MPLKVLTVDDSRTIRIIVKKAFKPYDVEVVEAENGAEGMTKAQIEKPDLIVLDITMPVMTGIEMLTQLKKDPQLKSIPVIMLTAESGKENVMQIIQMGVSNYIVKPFKGEQLIERAKTIVNLLPRGEAPASGQIQKDGRLFILELPEKITRPIISEMESMVAEKSGVISNSGTPNLLLNLQRVSEINVSLVKLILNILNKCASDNIRVAAFCNPGLEKDLKRLKELKGLEIHRSIEKAKASFA